MSAFVVVNPRSANGRTRRNWPALEPALSEVYPYMSVAFTRRRGEATALVSAALREGHSEIVAVGGDGTINEAINGFFDADGAVSPDAVLAFVPSGTGGDFPKTFGLTGDRTQIIAHLRQSRVRAVDVGRATFLSCDGIPRRRYFANIASFGLSGAIVDAVNRSVLAKRFGGAFAFGFHSALGLMTYRGRAVRLIVDSTFDQIITISAVAVANGTTFGAGMRIAPDARPDDGLFDVVVVASGSRRSLLANMKQIYSGTHLGNPSVRVIRGSKVVAAPVADTRGRAVLVETDGEGIGRLPATFEVLPRALNVRC
ncbi:MAG: diacylglycerol kinase family lipid kinase [Alphaproteobacteria bacterium]|nr:diacylglycerol kinase family lipid kinase [Alphaproteobacteria bacterium]